MSARAPLGANGAPRRQVSFIARYRKVQTNNIDPELLHEVAASHSYLHGLQTAVSKAYKQLNAEEKVRLRRTEVCSPWTLFVFLFYRRNYLQCLDLCL